MLSPQGLARLEVFEHVAATIAGVELLHRIRKGPAPFEPFATCGPSRACDLECDAFSLIDAQRAFEVVRPRGNSKQSQRIFSKSGAAWSGAGLPNSQSGRELE
jgi:hypothetical protein